MDEAALVRLPVSRVTAPFGAEKSEEGARVLVLMSLGRGLKLPRRVPVVLLVATRDAFELCEAELVRIRLAGIEEELVCDCVCGGALEVEACGCRLTVVRLCPEA